MKTQSRKLQNGDLEIVLTFDGHDQLCLEHDLLDIVDWYIKGPSSEKIYNCRTRMIRDNKDKLLSAPDMQKLSMEQVNMILADPIALCDHIRKLPDYKNRKEREESAPQE